LDDDSPLDTPKPKMKSCQLGGLETLLGDACKPPAEGSPRSRSAKHTLAESSQLAVEDQEFEFMIPFFAAAAIFNNHKHQNGIDD
jgi:hypothetical protein